MRAESRKWVQVWLLVLAASAIGGHARAVVTLDFTDTTDRTVDVFMNQTAGTCQSDAAAGEPGPAPASCFVYANDAGAVFEPTPSVTAELTFDAAAVASDGTSGTATITIAAADWETLFDQGSEFPADPGSFTDYVIDIDLGTNEVHGGLVDDQDQDFYWSGDVTGVPIIGSLTLQANDEFDLDAPFVGLTGLGDPMVASCAASGAPSPNPGDCPDPLVQEPGLTRDGPNGTVLTGFGTLESGFGRPATIDTDMKLVPEPSRTALVCSSLVTLFALARSRRSRS